MCEQSDEDDTTTTNATTTASNGDTNADTDPPNTLTPCPRCDTPVTTVSAIGPTDAIVGPAAVASRPDCSHGSERSDGNDGNGDASEASTINRTHTTTRPTGLASPPSARPNTARVLESRRSAGLSGVATVSGPRNHHNSGPPSHHHRSQPPPRRPSYSVDTDIDGGRPAQKRDLSETAKSRAESGGLNQRLSWRFGR